MNRKKSILLFADWYEPGYKAGGPIRSCVNFVQQMQADYQIYVFTSDRDLGSYQPYTSVRTDEWYQANENISLYYCSPRNLNWKNIRQQLISIAPDFIYLNSMFSPRFTIYPLLISKWTRARFTIVLSPRGMLRESAVQFKSTKKKIFLHGLRWFGLHRNIRFLASDETEQKDILRYFGTGAFVASIPNFPASFPEDQQVIEKNAGELTLIFVGRIHPIKNLDYLLSALRDIKSTIRLTIIGSLEDPSYWEKCRGIIGDLPPSITVQYAGEIPNHELPAIIAGHHIFALPTKGENFGHAIFEALALGKPVLISDQTPWRGLEASKAGWDLPLDQPGLFRKAFEQAAAFGQDDYNDWCWSTRQFVKEYVAQLNLKDEYIKLFS